MPRPLLPPSHVIVPVGIIYNKELQPALRDTWIQLRGLAWGRSETPELSIQQLSEILDKSRSTIYDHLRLLGLRGALSMRSASSGAIVVMFNADEESENLEMLNPLNSFSDSFDSSSNLKSKDSLNENNVLKPMINTLAEVTGLDQRLNYAQLAKVGKRLIQASYTAQQVAMTYGAVKNGQKSPWYSKDWRGKKLQKPTTGDVLKTIAELCKNLQSEEDSRREYAKWEDI